jgi:cbb3-type cytochrome oxidase subunit 3
MKLSDVMSAMDLAVYAEAGLVLFLLVFVSVAVHVMRRGGTDWDALRHLPLADGSETESLTSNRGAER